MKQFYAAIDLGTTTIEASLLRTDGIVLAKYGFQNPQSRFGSDVISRMTYLGKHPESEELRKCVFAKIREVLSVLLSGQGAEYPADLVRTVITGNTVMAAILLGINTESLGRAPFAMPMTETGIFQLDGIPAYVPVGASAFLGSDSCGGAWVLPLEENELLLDLGTNGEMLLCHDGRIHGASAACGPAFENCTRAQGVYGSTTLAAIARLIKRGKLPADGTIPEAVVKYGIYEDGTIPETSSNKAGPDHLLITPKILQEVMMAGAAIYATFCLLLKREECHASDIRRIYLAGGFGFHMSLRDAGTLGILPEALLGRATISGNTSLLAAEKMVLQNDASQSGGNVGEYDLFRRKVITHQFAGDREYEKLFLRSLNFNKRIIFETEE
ncbi:MAG: ASKHA domain-containing protein [Eubacterium sp.]|nr:ASKHA domain-containing protein [Eubacterium sp.]